MARAVHEQGARGHLARAAPEAPVLFLALYACSLDHSTPPDSASADTGAAPDSAPPPDTAPSDSTVDSADTAVDSATPDTAPDDSGVAANRAPTVDLLRPDATDAADTTLEAGGTVHVRFVPRDDDGDPLHVVVTDARRGAAGAVVLHEAFDVAAGADIAFDTRFDAYREDGGSFPDTFPADGVVVLDRDLVVTVEDPSGAVGTTSVHLTGAPSAVPTVSLVDPPLVGLRGYPTEDGPVTLTVTLGDDTFATAGFVARFLADADGVCPEDAATAAWDVQEVWSDVAVGVPTTLTPSTPLGEGDWCVYGYAVDGEGQVTAVGPARIRVAPRACLDADGDGYVPGTDCDGAVVAGDCDDGDATVSPGAPEVCNGSDDDCDGEVDDNGALLDPADATGDNDDGDHAFDLGGPEDTTWAGTIHNADDEDWFAWYDAYVDDTFYVFVDDLPEGDYTLEIYRQGGTSPMASTSELGATAIALSATTGAKGWLDDYWIRLFPTDLASPGACDVPYTLTME